ncbi:MAG: metal-dependent transcriptional regulator [Planctomycetota bacterium]
MSRELTPTLEDYLETIYRLERKKRVARPRDISEDQDVARSTVTSALQSLGEMDLINYEPYELITLTEEGRRKAEKLSNRHRIIRDFLESILGLNPDTAEETACGMEHAVGDEALERFVCFITFMRRCSSGGTGCLEQFREFANNAGNTDSCQECIDEYMKRISQ